MPKLKNHKYPVATAGVVEDPLPGASNIYFWLDAYDKTSLAPLLDVGMNQNTDLTTIAGFGETRVIAGGSFTARILTMGNITDVQVLNNTADVLAANIEPMAWFSMDPARPVRKVRYDTDGINNICSLWGNQIGGVTSYANASSGFPVPGSFSTRFNVRYNNLGFQTTTPRLNNVGEWASAFYFTSNNPASMGRGGGQWYYPVFYNINTNNLIVMGWGGWYNNAGAYNSNTGGNSYVPSVAFCAITSWIGTSPGAGQDPPVSAANKTVQMIGIDASNRCLFLVNDLTTDYNHIIYRYQDSNNTQTTLFNNSTAPSAGGTSVGGNRGTAFGNYLAKYSSQVFSDATSPGNKAWYTPYLDSAGNFHPFFFQWNTTSDTFTRNADITMNWGSTTQAAVWSADAVSGTSVNVDYGMQRLWGVETWTQTVSGSTRRYLMLMQLHGNGTRYDGVATARTFPVFWINPVLPKTLNYHSSIVVPTTPKNIIWLSADYTQLGVICDSAFYIYFFTDPTGWVLTSTIPTKFASVGLDNLGRIWALEAGNNTWGAIHTITATAPISITVTSTATSYNYTGQSINSTVAVNAYGTDGLRRSITVRLVIDGTSMTFAGSNLTTQVTTSASTDTSVPIILTGAGINNIIASVVL